MHKKIIPLFAHDKYNLTGEEWGDHQKIHVIFMFFMLSVKQPCVFGFNVNLQHKELPCLE